MPRFPTWLVFGLLLPVAAFAQGADISFDDVRQDTTLPVEVTADALSVSQADGTAVFRGNVLIAQGNIRLSAGEVLVVYAGQSGEGGGGRIAELRATGGVTFVSGNEAAEAREAVYDIPAGRLVMTGDVLLSQGASAISADRMVVDLTAGTGVMEGGVRTVFQPGDN